MSSESAGPPPQAGTAVAKAPGTPVIGKTLRLAHVEPYSVTRVAFVASVALMIISVIAVALLWIFLGITGVWGQINDSVGSVMSDGSGSFDVKDYIGFFRVIGATIVVSGLNVIFLTALATVGAHIYNHAATLLGGVAVTFSEED